MKKKQRLLLMTLSLVLIIALAFSGCSNDKNDSQEVSETSSTTKAADTAETAEEEAEEILEPVELILLVPGGEQKDEGIVEEAIFEYLKDTINVSLVIDQVDWGAWDDKNNLTIAGGEPCDLIFTAPWCGYVTNSAKGAFLDLTDLIEQYGQGILNQSYGWMIDATKTEGKLYAVPSYQMSAQNRGMVLRKDLVEKYGPQVGFEIKEVNKPEDIEPLFEVIKENEPDLTVCQGTAARTLVFCLPWDRQAVSEVTAINCYDETPIYKNVADTDIYREAISTARSWFEKGYFNEDIATTQEDSLLLMKAGSLFSFISQFQHNTEYDMSRNLGMDVLVYPLIQPIISTNGLQGAMFAIPVQSEHPERAMMLLNLMHTDKTLQNLLVFGVEGAHYEKVGDNTITLPEGIDPANHPYKNHMWMFGNQALIYDYDTDPPNGAQLLDEFNQSAIATPAIGFVYDSSAMKNEIAALANVADEFDALLATGTVDSEDGTYERYLQKLKDSGIDKLLEDQNAQLSKWMAANGK